jgi:hypothetical protein
MTVLAPKDAHPNFQFKDLQLLLVLDLKCLSLITKLIYEILQLSLEHLVPLGWEGTLLVGDRVH